MAGQWNDSRGLFHEVSLARRNTDIEKDPGLPPDMAKRIDVE